MAACPAGKGCKATARLGRRVNGVECGGGPCEPREEGMESWMAFEPPKVSLTTQLSPDLGQPPSPHAPPDNPPLASPLAKAFSNSRPRIVDISRNALYKAEISVYGLGAHRLWTFWGISFLQGREREESRGGELRRLATALALPWLPLPFLTSVPQFFPEKALQP